MKSGSNITQYDVIRELRFPMIVLVTYAHSYSYVADDFSLVFSDWNTYEFLKLLVSQTLVKVAVPVFFIISGYLFFANVETWNLQVYKSKMLRRAKTLLLPYLIWNLLMVVKLKSFSWSMFWAYWKPAGIQIDWLGHEQLMTAPANMPLWFLRDLIIVSLFTPIIYIGVRRLSNWLLGLLTVVYLSGVCAFIPGLSAYAVFFFTLGAFLSIRNMGLVDTFRRFEWSAYILSACFGLGMLLTFRMPVFSSLMLCFRLTAAVAVFNLAYRILSSTNRRLPKIVCDANYLIYLAHYVFFFLFVDTSFFAVFGLSTASLSVHYLLCPLLKVLLFVALYLIWRRFLDIVRTHFLTT